MRSASIVSTCALLVGLATQGASGCSGGRAGCVKSSDCAPQQVCAFKIGDCNAPGECLAALPPVCSAILKYCGCGSVAIGGCGYYPEGYASAPAIGSASCM